MGVLKNHSVGFSKCAKFLKLIKNHKIIFSCLAVVLICTMGYTAILKVNSTKLKYDVSMSGYGKLSRNLDLISSARAFKVRISALNAVVIAYSAYVDGAFFGVGEFDKRLAANPTLKAQKEEYAQVIPKVFYDSISFLVEALKNPNSRTNATYAISYAGEKYPDVVSVLRKELDNMDPEFRQATEKIIKRLTK